MTFDIKKITSSLQAEAAAARKKNPFRDWRAIIVTFLAVTFAGLLWSIYLFWLITTDAMYAVDSPVSTKVEALNKAGAGRLIEGFAERQRRFDEVRAATSTAIDPSL